MVDREPTIRSRELGEGLRHAMENAGLSGVEAARHLGWSPGWVSRLLNGKRGCKDVEVAQFLGMCHVHGREAERLMALVHDQDTPGWLQQHGSTMPKQLRTLIDHENKATAISAFESAMVPGLLQTPQYARAVISRCVNVPANEVEDRVAARRARQTLLTRFGPPRFTFFVHEFVLRTPVGGTEVMSEQLHELLRMSVRPFLSLRVVPAVLGAHAALTGSFRLMEFPEFRPVAYLESETSSLFLEKPDEIRAYRNVLAALAATALSEGQSREVIGTIATELYEDHDAST
jgi:transcriptional regulator with XRE-family HTH domain